MEIQIEHLTKRYGKKEVLKDVSFRIPKGMYGLLGKNGAGKTTLLRILATLLQKTEGEIFMNQVPIENCKKIRGMIGYLPQEFSVYPNMKVDQIMEYFDILCEMPEKGRKNRIAALLSSLNLEGQTKMKVKALSGGMKQRLGMAIALLNNPKVLIIDEPTTGLDPEERIRLRNLLCKLAESRIVLLSTHIVEDIEATCKRVGVIYEGRLVFQGSTSELAAVAAEKVYTLNPSELHSIKTDQYTVISKKQDSVRILADSPGMEGYKKCMPDIEDGYMQLMKENREEKTDGIT